MGKTTQAQRVLDYIEEFGSITQLDALQDLGVMRLASRISDLRKRGYPINSKAEAVKNRYGEKSYIKRYTLQNVVPVAVGQNVAFSPLKEITGFCTKESQAKQAEGIVSLVNERNKVFFVEYISGNVAQRTSFKFSQIGKDVFVDGRTPDAYAENN